MAEEETTLEREELPYKVELTRNAKGITQIAVRVKGIDGNAVKAEAQALYNALCSDHPLSGGE